jgi:hypothetical protein
MGLTPVVTEDWLLRLPPAAAATTVLAAMERAGMTVTRAPDGTLHAQVKGSWRRNRWKAVVDVAFAPEGAVTRARCRVDMAGDKHLDVLDDVLAGIDPALLDDRGAGAAAAAAGDVEPRALRGLRSHLRAEESVAAVGRGAHDGRPAVVALTDRRVLVHARTRAGETLEEVPRAQVEALEADGAGGLVIRAAGRRLALARMRPGHPEALAAAFGPAEPSAEAADPIDQLRRLGELRDAGVVTQAEFEAKKAALLDRIR